MTERKDQRCVQCGHPVGEHLLRGGSFTLWCPDKSGRAQETIVEEG